MIPYELAEEWELPSMRGTGTAHRYIRIFLSDSGFPSLVGRAGLLGDDGWSSTVGQWAV